MSQYPPAPPPSQPVYVPPAPLVAKTSGLAVASLVCSLIFCIPLLGLIGAILGIIALGATKRPGVGGRGLAIAGIIVGFLATAVWGIGIVGASVVFKMLLGEADQPVAAFVSDYNEGNDRAIYDAASADFRNEVPYAKLHEILDAARAQWGRCERMGAWDMTTNGGFQININNDRMEANMAMRFAKSGPQKVEWTFRKEAGQWRLLGVRFESLAYDTTAPPER